MKTRKQLTRRAQRKRMSNRSRTYRGDKVYGPGYGVFSHFWNALGAKNPEALNEFFAKYPLRPARPIHKPIRMLLVPTSPDTRFKDLHTKITRDLAKLNWSTPDDK